MNMVPVQGVLTALMKVESSPIRQALWELGYEIDSNDMIDLDAIDQKKLKDAIKNYVKGE